MERTEQQQNEKKKSDIVFVPEDLKIVKKEKIIQKLIEQLKDWQKENDKERQQKKIR